MSENFFHHLGLTSTDIEPYKLASVGTAKNGSSLKILGRLKQPLKMYIGHSDYKFKTRPIVVQGLSMPFNISGPFLSRHNIDQIHSASSLKHNNKLLPLFSRQGVQQIHCIDVNKIRPLTVSVQAKHEVVVPAFSISKITLEPTSDSCANVEGDAIIVGSETFARITNLHPPTGTLSHWSKGEIHTTVMNTLDIPVKINKSQYFGEAKTANANKASVPGVIAYIDRKKEVKDEIHDIAKPLEKLTLDDEATEEEVKEGRAKRWKWLKDSFKLNESPFLKNYPERMKTVLRLLERYYDLFSQGDKYGRTELLQHEICTQDVPPIRCKGRPINPVMETNLKEQLNTWLDQGVVSPSHSPWSFPMIAVPKKNGKTRWVIDYRRLNDVTIKDSFPLPNIEDNLSRLSQSQIFSGIDGAGAFHVIPIRDQDREKTAFSTPWGLYEFNYMPFGLCNAPATYSRLVQKVLEGIPTDIALPYLDDTCIHTVGFDEHISALEQVFQAHENAGLTLQPSKCQLFQTSIEYLGHVVSARGIAPIPRHLSIIKDWPFPNTITQLRTFLGKTNYYRKFVQDYSKILNPVTQLLKGATSKNQPIEKTPEAEAAFNTIKAKLMESPILAYPQFWSEEPFILDTDWSRDHNSIGAVLSQVQDGAERVIIYGAKRLNSAQANYSSNKGEIYAAIYFITLWKYYLSHRKFILRTDHQAMRWIRTMAEPKGMILRWLETLSDYEFEVVFRPGTKHANADALSRTDHADEIDPEAVEDEFGQPGIKAIQTPHPWSHINEVKELQEKDPTLITVKEYILQGQPPGKLERRKQPTDVQHYLSIYEQLSLNSENLIIRTITDPTGDPLTKLCVPLKLQTQIVKEAHEQGGHMGINVTEERVKNNFHFPRIRDVITETIQCCGPCQEKKMSQKAQRHTLISQQAGYPFQRISIDLVGPFQRSLRGNTHLLTVRDCFTRWIEAFPMRDTKAKALANVLSKQIFSRYGIPERVHSDQGANFTSDLLKAVYQSFGIQATTTPAYNPKSNPVERVHQDLGRMLRALCGKRPTEWEDHVPAALLALRTAKNRHTGFTPYRLLFGREASMPTNLVYGDPEHRDHQHWLTHDWAKEIRERCSKAMAHAQKNMDKVIIRARQRYYNKVDGKPLEEHDLVWLITPRVPLGTSKKLHSPWTGPWKILEKISDVLFSIATEGAWSKKPIQLQVSIDRLARYQVQNLEDGVDVAPQGQEFEPEDFQVQDEFLEGGLEEEIDDDALNTPEAPVYVGNIPDDPAQDAEYNYDPGDPDDGNMDDGADRPLPEDDSDADTEAPLPEDHEVPGTPTRRGFFEEAGDEDMFYTPYATPYQPLRRSQRLQWAREQENYNDTTPRRHRRLTDLLTEPRYYASPYGTPIRPRIRRRL